MKIGVGSKDFLFWSGVRGANFVLNLVVGSEASIATIVITVVNINVILSSSGVIICRRQCHFHGVSLLRRRCS